MTHATSAVELRARTEAGAEEECGDLGALEHSVDAFETSYAWDVVAFELRPVTLAPRGAESEPLTEPMIRIEGGMFDANKIAPLWIPFARSP